MFWVGLSMMIMSMTGKGDDTAMFRRYVESLREAIEQVLMAPERKKRALASTEELTKGFWKMRVDYDKVGKCLEKADRNYFATRADYEACLTPVDSIWDAATDTLVDSQNQLTAAMTDQEKAAVDRLMAQGK